MAKLWERLEHRRVRRFYHESDEMYAGVRPNPEHPPGTDMIPQIKHIVVLMMENHSFDSYLGLLGKGDGLPVDATTGLPTAANSRVDGTVVESFRAASTTQLSGAPTQSWHATNLQWNQGSNDGFVRSVEQTIAHPTDEQARSPMSYWTEQDLPFYAGLARTFPLAERWFCSCLGPTFPNRRFLIAGTAHGLIDDLPFGMIDIPKAGTIFDLLTRNDISWANYHDVSQTRTVARRLLGRGGLVAFRRLGLLLGKLVPGLLHNAIGNLQFTADLYPLSLASAWGHLRTLDDFFAAADAGTLPAVSIVDPNFSKFSEENPQDIHLGEGFAAEVINRVMHGKGWPDTVLIWVYDEPGGYYDHVPPPAAPEPDDVEGRSLLQLPTWIRTLLAPLLKKHLAALQAIDACTDLRYDRYGFRVPAVIVSPYAKPGQVLSTLYDHTSVLKLIEHKWNLPSLTRRDAAAHAPLEALDLENPNFAEPPDLPAPAVPWSSAPGQ